MELTITHDQTINSETVIKHFQKLKNKYPDAPSIHLTLDNGPYNTSQEVKQEAQRKGIRLHYLPTYSPNLNAIEQLWKVMNEEVRNNRFFSSAKEFRQSILDFFEHTWPLIAPQKVDRVNDYFRVLKK